MQKPRFKLALKKLQFISILSLFFGCASIGGVSPAMTSHMGVLKTQDIPMMIVDIYISKPNSVGGVDAYVIPRITSSKTIKYVSITFSVFNAVGDEVYDSKWGGEFILNNTGFNDFTGQATGPLNFGDKVEWKWTNAWYNSDIHCLKLQKIEIEYMDSNIDIWEGKKLTKLYAPDKFKVGMRSETKWSTVCDW